jgi:hypothetical protein
MDVIIVVLCFVAFAVCSFLLCCVWLIIYLFMKRFDREKNENSRDRPLNFESTVEVNIRRTLNRKLFSRAWFSFVQRECRAMNQQPLGKNRIEE